MRVWYRGSAAEVELQGWKNLAVFAAHIVAVAFAVIELSSLFGAKIPTGVLIVMSVFGIVLIPLAVLILVGPLRPSASS